MNSELKWIVQTGTALLSLLSLLQFGRERGWL
jgi:hypothetical protein